MGRRQLIAAAALALGASSCVQFTWQKQRIGSILPEGHIQWALDTRPDVNGALERLGAPVLVRDREEQGYELVWVWRHTSSFDLGVSLPLDHSNVSFQGNQSDDQALGLRLAFDASGHFVEGARGHVLATR